jgi:hypothetical protein
MEINTCKNCGHTFEDTYCNHCGQKNYTDKDKSFKHLADEVLHFLTHFEGSFLRTLKTIMTQPGRLSLDYCHGKRKPYYKPISFFLFIVVIYLVFPLAKGMNPEMPSYESNKIAGSVIQQQIRSRIANTGLTAEQLSEKFHTVSSKTSKILLLLLIPFSALIFYLLYMRRKAYAFDFFILSTEFNSFILLFFFILLPLLIFPVMTVLYIPDTHIDQTLEPFILIITLTYTSILLHRFFEEKWLFSILKSMVFFVVLMWLILPLYQLIIFEITFASI